MSNKNPFNPNSVYFIAEAGVNHNGSVPRAKRMIDIAEDAGADAVKFQSYVAEASVTDQEEKVKYQAQNTQKSESQLEMLRKYELSYEDHCELISYCDGKNIEFLTTVSTIESINKVKDLDIPVFKIGSPDLNNYPSLEYVLELETPLIISTGMSNIDEVTECFKFIKEKNSNLNVAFLHCVSDYPANIEELNLKSIQSIREKTSVPVGFSDHSVYPEIPSIAVGFGATIIEKHFTLDKTLEGPDHQASLEPSELEQAITLSRLAMKASGDGIKEPTPSELENRSKVRRSIHVTSDIEPGDIIRKDNIRICRPATGLEPKYWESVINTPAARSLSAGDPLTRESVNDSLNPM
ncbi:N-acetylneuraminate synthase family protein [Natrialbaceae archaeon A-arb3/5]